MTSSTTLLNSSELIKTAVFEINALKNGSKICQSESNPVWSLGNILGQMNPLYIKSVNCIFNSAISIWDNRYVSLDGGSVPGTSVIEWSIALLGSSLLGNSFGKTSENSLINSWASSGNVLLISLNDVATQMVYNSALFATLASYCLEMLQPCPGWFSLISPFVFTWMMYLL